MLAVNQGWLGDSARKVVSGTAARAIIAPHAGFRLVLFANDVEEKKRRGARFFVLENFSPKHLCRRKTERSKVAAIVYRYRKLLGFRPGVWFSPPPASFSAKLHNNLVFSPLIFEE